MPQPVPQFKNVQDIGSAEGSYFAWVDQFDTLGLGANTPIATGNQSDALPRAEGREVGRRSACPYPMGFYTKWMDGRIDNPNARMEGPRAVVNRQQPRAVPHGDRQGDAANRDAFQMRPDPLAK